MRLLTCPVCGGKRNIKIGTEFAACDSCGNVTKIDPVDAERFTEIYRSAERSMRLNSVEGYEEALHQLDSISFIEETRKKRVECEKRLQDLQADLQRRQAQGSASEQQNTGFAGVLLAVTLVFCAAALAGVAWLVVLLLKGALSPRATAAVIAIAALAVLFTFINKVKRINQ
jgi:transcription initiation factor TFIIIB Brf1 subunit/transcription initiation factor TFIIB